MGKVRILLSVGAGLVISGFIYSFIDEVLVRYIIPDYVYNPTGPYYLGSALLWDMIPYVLIIVGVMCLITAPLAARSSSRRGVNE